MFFISKRAAQVFDFMFGGCPWLLLTALPLTAANHHTEKETSSDLLHSIEHSLQADITEAWYPRVIDTEYGGFLSNFDAEWNPDERQAKAIVAQSRHVWTCAQLSKAYPENSYLKEAALDGSQFLIEHFWDSEHGGFFWLTNQAGEAIPNQSGSFLKETYGNAFAIYALAAVYEVTGNKEALEAAQRGFAWLEYHAHDNNYGGYFEKLTLEGNPIWNTRPNDFPKGQNTTIHLLEAFTQLYKIWPDQQVKRRVEELKKLLLDRIIDPRGYLIQFFDEQWTPVSLQNLPPEQYHKLSFFDHVSFGHDVETAYLLWEADQVLGGEDQARVLEMGKRLLDHTLEHGWDPATGSIPDGGFYFTDATTCTIVRPERTWWAQAELLNALLMFGKLYPDDPHNYFAKAQKTWTYIQQNLVDHEHGGWYENGIDFSPESQQRPKSHIWKAAYHNSRALLNARHWLNNSARALSHHSAIQILQLYYTGVSCFTHLAALTPTCDL